MENHILANSFMVLKMDKEFTSGKMGNSIMVNGKTVFKMAQEFSQILTKLAGKENGSMEKG